MVSGVNCRRIDSHYNSPATSTMVLMSQNTAAGINALVSRVLSNGSLSVLILHHSEGEARNRKTAAVQKTLNALFWLKLP